MGMSSLFFQREYPFLSIFRKRNRQVGWLFKEKCVILRSKLI